MNSPAQFLRCPRCRGKTRIQVRSGTLLRDFPLFCPKCRYECIIDYEKGKITATKTPDRGDAVQT